MLRMGDTLDEEDVLVILMCWKYKTHVCKSRSRGDDFSPKFRCRRAAAVSFPPALSVTVDCACEFDQANNVVLGFVLVLGS